MALIHNPPKGSNTTLKKQAALLAAIALTLVTTMVMTSQNPLTDALPIVLTSLALVIFFSLFAMKKNPLMWMRLFRPYLFEKVMSEKKLLMGYLKELGDDCHIFHWIYLEFFRIDFLVVSPMGIFILKAVFTKDMPLDGSGKQFIQEDQTFAREASRLWRLCHMINLLIRKGYKTDIMPQPLMVIMDRENQIQDDEYRGITIVSPGAIVSHIKYLDTPVETPMVQGFAGFIKSRYAS